MEESGSGAGSVQINYESGSRRPKDIGTDPEHCLVGNRNTVYYELRHTNCCCLVFHNYRLAWRQERSDREYPPRIPPPPLQTSPSWTPKHKIFGWEQCWESVKFWGGSVSMDPYLRLTDPDTDPTPFFNDFRDAKKKILFIFFSYNLPASTLSSVLKIYPIFCYNFVLKNLLCKHYLSQLNTFMKKRKDLDPDPDPYLWLMDPVPEPGGHKTGGSPTLVESTVELRFFCASACCKIGPRYRY